MINLHHQVFGRKAIVKNEGLILDLPFQNSFVDATGKNTMIAGGNSNLPTFTLEGGEYAATFNGSQSIKTTTNLLLNSDKVTIAFWVKMNNTSQGIIGELNTAWDNGSTFIIMANQTATNFLFGDHNSQYVLANTPSPSIGSWNHFT